MATERRIILIGKTGNGKSSTGNTLLGRSAFKTGDSLTAVTQKCQIVKSDNDIRNIRYTVCDTPGLMDTDTSRAKLLLEVQRSLKLCPEPHAFLLIFSSVIRMTEDEKYTIDLLRITFGEDVFNHCIVVFTHGNRFKSDQEFKIFWKQSEMVVDLVERCKYRLTRIENTGQVQYENAITYLVEAMSDGGRIKYQYPEIQVHSRMLQARTEQYDGRSGVDLYKELSLFTHALGRVLSEDTWKVMLVGGAIAALGVTGVGAGAVVVLAAKAGVAKVVGGALVAKGAELVASGVKTLASK